MPPTRPEGSHGSRAAELGGRSDRPVLFNFKQREMIAVAKGSKLSDRQLKFCRELVLGKAKTQEEAAIVAGYSVKTARFIASRLLTKGNINAEIARLRKIAREQAILSARERMEILSAQARGEKPYEVVKIRDPNGGVTTRLVHRPVAAIAELNKMDGSYSPEKLEVTDKDPTEGMTEEELEDYIARNEALLAAIKKRRKK